MKLRNKKTGEIKEVIVGGYPVSGRTKIWECSEMDANEETGYISLGTYTSLAELNDEWEDYEEPKQDALSMIILTLTNFIENEPNDNADIDDCKQMLEKLKAWKRLKNKGFKFNNWYYGIEPFKNGKMNIDIKATLVNSKDKFSSDLDLLCGD